MWNAEYISYKGNTNFIRVYKGEELVWEKPQSGDKIIGYDVWLINIGVHKVDLIKVVRKITGLGLKDGKELVDSAPVSIIQTDNEEVAQSAYNDIMAVGGGVVAEIRCIYE